MAKFCNTLLAATALFTSIAHAVSPLVVEGSNFVNSVDGSRFQMIGVAYQPGGSAGFDPASGIDPLSDASVCLRDATLMQILGVNTIRVYNLDPDLDHQACASIFNAAGIYMLLDVNSPLPNQSIDRSAPWDSYNLDYLTRVFAVVEAFMAFDNTLGFFSGNEVINQDAVPQVPGYIRAVTRDLKDYIAAQSSRTIPVGYSAADIPVMLTDSLNYLGCELSNSTTSNIDFFGLNSYSWCGDSTFTDSGYNVLVSTFSNTTVPIFFSEFGCNNISPRVFTEVPVLYGPQMTGVMSGGIVYEYSEEVNNYGLVTIQTDGSINMLEDYFNLQKQYDTLDISSLTASNSTATHLKAAACAPDLIGESTFENTFDLPAAPAGVQELITNGVSGASGYPKSFSQVTATAVTQTVYNNASEKVTGLTLRILASDESNAPGNNTSGTFGSGTPTSSGSSPTKTNAAAGLKVGHMQTGSLVMVLLTAAFMLRL